MSPVRYVRPPTNPPPPPTPMGPVALAEALAHRHRWVYDGMTPVGIYIYHCDDHDPPIIRTIIHHSPHIQREEAEGE